MGNSKDAEEEVNLLQRILASHSWGESIKCLCYVGCDRWQMALKGVKREIHIYLNSRKCDGLRRSQTQPFGA